MESANQLEKSVIKSIEASIAVKECLLKNSDLIATVSRVTEVLIAAFGAGAKCSCLATAEAPQTHSTSRRNSLGALRLIVQLCLL